MSALAPRIALAGRRCRIPSQISHTRVVAGSLSRHDVSAATSLRYLTPMCHYSSSSLLASDNKKKEFAKLPRLEDANPERIHGIEVNPDSLGYGILPGNLIYKTYKWSGNTRKVPLELAHGYFWMVTDLKKTNQKPTFSNEKLISEKEAQVFPVLEGLTSLEDLDTNVDLPFVFLEHAHGMQKSKKAKKPGAGKITLVAVSFRDNGFKMVDTWMEPFEKAFGIDESSNSSKVQTFSVSITERWALYPIRNSVKRVMKKNTPVNKHATTLAYFGTKEVMDFRDVLRMHNVMTSYVFLLDDLGRVRFAGSGEANEEESERLVQFAKELVQEGNKPKRSKNKR
eukprot:CAMPEP_0116089770 /NCGR_PEP_ID=MMETSP0327-20121206/6597_1 /TAXON_ID=44447 /ORGANISM="Pseudo-nitzschia delicatissima, Strain B596" /LENGTH=339 /DNA_ID=CAMNT_0003580973 /DNA_START=29 /DNA_END=1048 /DNA_ORIENTATION=-